MALESSIGKVTSETPNLRPRRKWLLVSSASIRTTSSAVGSSALSNVIMSTPSLHALRTNEMGLQGFAKMMRVGSTPRSRIWVISLFDAQSKPVPKAARRRRTYGSGLHLMAMQGTRSKIMYPLKRTIKKVGCEEDKLANVNFGGKPDSNRRQRTLLQRLDRSWPPEKMRLWYRFGDEYRDDRGGEEPGLALLGSEWEEGDEAIRWNMREKYGSDKVEGDDEAEARETRNEAFNLSERASYTVRNLYEAQCQRWSRGVYGIQLDMVPKRLRSVVGVQRVRSFANLGDSVGNA
ncbi:hypothetical protein B0H17DRAFT_1128512 [Mycena rosella]|uniref:Uncharacterized protein n=1 Tax=Mycena rosella TaxID=1033263 RepID=A0AAD7DW95_MYCRO|nr:hypothetical protein B0H17DRAFT_1128512 [Mycena rosella]